MNWLALAVVILGIVLVLKVAGFLVKLLLLVIVLGGAYWLIAPHVGLPLPL